MKTKYILIFILSYTQVIAKPKSLLTPNPPTGFGVSIATICSGSNSMLSASCASGVVNWFTSATGGSAIGTGSPVSNSPVETTTYYASCKDGISESSRVIGPSITVLADLAVGARIPQINLSGTLSNNDPTFRRTLAFSQGGACALSNIGTAVRYTTKNFTLATASTVTASLLSADGASLSPNGADTFLALYSSFNPTAVCTNIIAANDDAGAGVASKITTTTPLPAGTYTIVITSLNNVPTNTNDAALPWSFTAVVQASSIGVASAPSNLRVNGGINTFDICPAVSVALTGTCANGTIKWYTSLAATTAVGSGSPLTIVPAITTTYYAACENKCSASARVATQEITVTQVPNPPTNVSVSQAAVCFGTSITLLATCDASTSFNKNLTPNEKELFKAGLLNASTLVNNGTKTLKWYDQASGGTLINTGTGLVITPTINSNYYAACENACGSSARIAKAVSVTPIPTAPTATGVSICSGTIASLSANCLTGNIVWYSSPTGLGGIANSPLNTPILTTNTDYYVACESGGVINCASDRTKVTVNIFALPIATVSSITPICAGTTLSLSSGNTGTSPTNAYAWSGVNAFTSSQQNPSISNATVSATGTYQVIITNDKGCTALATTSAIVNALPIATASSITPICAGTMLSLSSGNTGTSPTNTYAWSGVNAFTSSQQNPSISNATVSATGTYQVIVTNDKGCTALTTTAVLVNSTPVTPTAMGGTINKGNAITITATGCTGTSNWYETLSNNAVTMPVSPTITTQYYTKCESIANGITCSSPKSDNVSVTVIYIVYVNAANTNAPLQNGESWITAFVDLQAGLSSVSASKQVWIAKGIYKPTNTITRTVYFNIPTDVKVYGGFMGTENLLEQRNITTNQTILSGEIGNQAIQTDNSYHVVFFDGSSNDTVLDGFTITGGNSNFNPNTPLSNQLNTGVSPATTTIETGGGVALQNGSNPMINTCVIINNSASVGGGIYAADASKPTIINCKVVANQATFGSGIYLQSGSHATVTNTLIAGNKGLGSVYNNMSNPVLTNCTLAGNGGYGGSIFNSNSQPIIKNSILWGNAPPFNDNQSVISNSTVQGGYAGVGNLNYDPQFVAASPEAIAPNSTGDYHLKASSLAIDRGDNGIFKLTDLDLDGNFRRFSGGRIDMGAYEFQGSATAYLVISVTSGNWNANSTWNTGRVPQINDIVIIDSTHNITVNNVSEMVKNIEFKGTGKVLFNSSATKLNIGF